MKTEPNTTLFARTTLPFKERLAAYCASKDMSVSQFIRDAVRVKAQKAGIETCDIAR